MAGESRVVLHAFWISSCSWRVRAALHWKRIPFEERAVDIVKEKQQLTSQYRAINPAQKVPALVIDGETLVESMAILQYLEDTRPEPSLTPNTPLLRARMREICETIVSGIQPLQNVGLRPQLDTDQKYQHFCQHFADRGLQTLEDLLQKSAGRFCVGDQVTMADLCLVPQVYNAVTRYTVVSGIQPLQSGLRSQFDTEEQYLRFSQHFVERGLQTLEDLLQKSAGRCCIGDQFTMADLCLVPQVYNAVTWLQLDIAKYPTISKLYETLLKEKVFEETHPKSLKRVKE